jgi:hypothetical protein
VMETGRRAHRLLSAQNGKRLGWCRSLPPQMEIQASQSQGQGISDSAPVWQDSQGVLRFVCALVLTRLNV